MRQGLPWGCSQRWRGCCWPFIWRGGVCHALKCSLLHCWVQGVLVYPPEIATSLSAVVSLSLLCHFDRVRTSFHEIVRHFSASSRPLRVHFLCRFAIIPHSHESVTDCEKSHVYSPIVYWGERSAQVQLRTSSSVTDCRVVQTQSRCCSQSNLGTMVSLSLMLRTAGTRSINFCRGLSSRTSLHWR